MNAFGTLSQNSMIALQIGSAECRSMKHFYLGVEHIVIGLCKVMDEELLAVMRDVGFDRKFFRRSLRESLGVGVDTPPWGTEMLVTPRLTAIVGISEKIARYCKGKDVRPAHLFLAVLLENRSLPARALARLGLDVERLKLRLYEALQGKTISLTEGGSSSVTANTPYLDSLGRDLTQLARSGKLRPVVGRREELLSITRTLARQTKNNVLLIGDPGVGKTCIVEALAQRCIRDDAPLFLRGRRIVELTMGSLLAGTQFRGDFEKRVEGILKEAKDRPEVILFLDEFHLIVGSGAAGGSALDAANMFKPALGRGEIRCIGATTVTEYHRHIEKDPALERRFEVVVVNEPSTRETLDILSEIKPALESYHGVTITEDALRETVRLGERFIADRRFPDKAVDILDRACSEVRLQSLTANNGDLKPEPVTGKVIARIVSQQTGVPVGSLTKEDSAALLNLEGRLRERVVGQEEAISLVTQAVIAGRQFESLMRPKGVFLFLGTTGVGKTELAKALSATLFGSERHLVRFDMSEYSEPHSVMRLIGAPPSYVGYDDEGQLTKAVRRRPYSVILLDEIEKAHPDLINLFLQVFDDGRLTDSKGRTADFTQTMVIMTSNLGSDSASLSQKNVGFLDDSGRASTDERRQLFLDHVIGAVKKHFKPEFVNRIDEMVVFNPITRASLEKILSLLLREIEEQLAERNLRLEITQETREFLMDRGFDENYGARELRRCIDSVIRKPLAKVLLKESFLPGETIAAVLSEGREVQFRKAAEVRS